MVPKKINYEKNRTTKYNQRGNWRNLRWVLCFWLKRCTSRENKGEVTKSDWDRADFEQRMDWLLQAFKDPDDAEKHVEKSWEDLPSVARGYMMINEEQMEMSFKTFEDIKDEMSKYSGFEDLGDGFKLPALGLMGDKLKKYYTFHPVDDQTVNVKQFNEYGEQTGTVPTGKNHPISVFANYMEQYGS